MKKILFTLFFLPLFTTAQVITTVAGDGSSVFADNVPATSTGLYFPACARTDQSGNIFIAEVNRCRIRKVTPSGIITTVAGSSVGAQTGDNGPATAAIVSISTPMSVAPDTKGNLYIAESAMGGDLHNGPWVRKVDAAGIITTYAGSTTGFSGDGGPATAAEFHEIDDIAIDNSGNVLLTDNNRVRKIDAAGIITTIAGNGSSTHSGDGGPATDAALDYPYGIAIDQNNNIYLACWHYIRRIDNSTGIITTIGGNGIYGYTDDGGPATNAQIRATTIAVDKAGNVYFAQRENSVVRKIDPAGIVSTIAGTGVSGYSGDNGPAIKAQLGGIFSVSVDDAGDVYVAEYGSLRVRKICMSCTASLVPEISKERISIYPNPAHQELTIAKPGKTDEISIINALGQVVYQGMYNADKAVIAIATFASGHYFIKINNEQAGVFIKE